MKIKKFFTPFLLFLVLASAYTQNDKDIYQSLDNWRPSVSDFICGDHENSTKNTKTKSTSRDNCIICDDSQIKYIRINFHFLLSDNANEPQNFTETDDGKGNTCYTGFDYADDLLHGLNNAMERNFEAGNPVPNLPNTPDLYPPKRIQFILDGVYFHRVQSIFSFPEETWNATLGVNTTTVINTYLYYGAGGGGYSASLISGAPEPAIQANRAWSYYNTQNEYFNYHKIADNINHEIGHMADLCHSFANSNPCGIVQDPALGDIHVQENCDNPNASGSCESGNGGCNAWDSGDNNFMGYNNDATNMTPCQLEALHSHFEDPETYAPFVAFCCDDWSFDIKNNPNLTQMQIGCDFSNCDIPTIIPTLCEGETTSQICYDVSAKGLTIQWEINIFDENGVPTVNSPVMGSGNNICIDIDNTHSFELCLIVDGEDCGEKQTCWALQTIENVSDGFEFVHEIENDGLANEFHTCEDVLIDASSSMSGASSHYYSLWKLDENGNNVFLVWTKSFEADPSVPVNITSVFESTEALFDASGNPASPIDFELGVTYTLQLGINYGGCETQKVRKCFTVVENSVEFHFEHMDGVEDTIFDICEDVFIDASESDGPAVEYHFSLFEINGANNPFLFWLPSTSGDPENPTNITDIINTTSKYDANGNLVENFEFECDKTYRVRLSIKCADYPKEYMEHDFTIICEDICESCESPDPYIKIDDINCIYYIMLNNSSDCSIWEITYVNTSNEEITETFNDITLYTTASDLLGPLEACIQFCGDACVTSEPMCVSISAKEVTNCALNDTNSDEESNDILLSPNPSSGNMTISINSGLMNKLIIMDLNGIVKKKINLPNVESAQINVSFLPTGNYKMIVETTENEIVQSNFVKN